jgi:aminoglycoside 6-adenylyltransferase
MTNIIHRAGEVAKTYEHLLQRILAWANAQDNIRAVVQVGSRVRQDHPGDEWADIDLMLYLTTPETYNDSTDWLTAVAPVWMAIPSYTAGNDPELLVMFEGGYNVDFVFCPVGALDWLRDHASEDMAYRHGGRVLLDRDGRAASVIPTTPSVHHPQSPSERDLDVLCQSFWYTCVYIARQIRRGDCWVAQMASAQQKQMLLKMLEWHTGVKSQWQRDTWHNGRFIQEWADPRALEELPYIFGGFKRDSAAKALRASAVLFHWLAEETAAGLGYPYNKQIGERASALIHEALDGC